MVSKIKLKHIGVDIYRDDKRRFERAGIILMDAQAGVHGFAYHKDYDGPPLDPIHLDYRRDGRTFRLTGGETLHGVFMDLLPGYWGSRLLERENPEYARMNAAERLHYLGSRHIGAFYLRCVDENGTDMPVRGLRNLDAVRDRAIRFYMLEIQDNILTDMNRYSLTCNHGGRPKCEFELRSGDRWIAKFNVPECDPYNMARVEHAMNSMARAAGLSSVETAVEQLPMSKQEVLLVKRYDRKGRDRLHRVSMASLVGVDNVGKEKAGTADYLDMVKVIQDISANPEEDLRELFGRMMFHAGINNVDNHLRNFEMILTAEGWRLAPNYDSMPEDGASMYSTSMCRYTHRDLGLRFVDHAAEQFGLPLDEGRRIAHRVFSTVLEFKDHAQEAKLSMQDALIVNGAIKTHEVSRTVQQLEATGAAAPPPPSLLEQAVGYSTDTPGA